MVDFNGKIPFVKSFQGIDFSGLTVMRKGCQCSGN